MRQSYVRCKLSLLWHTYCYKKRAEDAAIKRPSAPLRHMTKEEQDQLAVIEAQVRAAAKGILDQQPAAKQWGVAEHCAMLSNLAAEYDCSDKDQKQMFRKLLAFQGCGGNSSQFRQWLVKEKLITSAASKLADYN
jgi:hypothetical protein